VARVALSAPVIKTVALASGTSRAARRLRRKEVRAGEVRAGDVRAREVRDLKALP
jgi:hypothetical protein